MTDVSGALSDISLNTKLPYLIPHLPVLQTAHCTRGGGILCPPERLPAPSSTGPFRIFQRARFLAFVFLPFAGLCATVLHLLRRGISIHSATKPAIRALQTNLAKYIISGAIDQSAVCAAKLSSERRNLRPSSHCTSGTTNDTQNRAQLP